MTTVPYQPEVFCAFIAAVGRFFYDDAVIVLLDFLAREQRAFSEAEMKEILNWREALLMQQLAKLEQQLLVEKIIEAERGSRTIYLWRLHPQVCSAVGWRLSALMEQLQHDVESATEQSALICPECGSSVSLLDAACGPKALEDDHPLCKNCSAKLTTCNSEQARHRAEDRLARAHKSLAYLHEFIVRVSGMEVPSFTSEKYEPPDRSATKTTTGADSNAAASSETMGNADTNSSVEADQKSEASAAAEVSRVIPWFMSAAQQTQKAAQAARMSNEETATVSFGRSQSKGSALSAASVAVSASSVLGGGAASLTGTGLGGGLAIATGLGRPSVSTPRDGAALSGGVLSRPPTTPGIMSAVGKPGAAKPFSLSLKIGTKSDLSDGSGQSSRLMKRPAESILSKAFDKKVRF